MPGAFRPFARRLIATGAWCSANGQAATIVAVSPQGEVAPVRQVCVRFSEAVVPFGELQPPDPMHVTCRGAAPAGTGRCADDRVWLHDFRAAMWAGGHCRLTLRAERKPIGTAGDATKSAAGEPSTPAALTRTTEFNFRSAGPAVVSMQPHDGGQFAQAGPFLLRLSGAAVEATELANTWYEVEGIGERFGMRVIGGDAREQLLKARRIEKPHAERSLEFLATDIPADTNARARTFGLNGLFATRGFAAVKTNTSKDMCVNGCIGFTDRHTVGVWVGNAGGAAMRLERHQSGCAGVARTGEVPA